MEGTLGEIRIVALKFIPKNWAECNGQLLAITKFPALYAIIGNNYGGDGRVSFALPNLRGRVPLQAGQGPGLPRYRLGQTGGEEKHTLTEAEMPAHSHHLYAHTITATATINSSSDDSSNTDDPTNANPSLGETMYSTSLDAAMATAPVTITGDVELYNVGGTGNADEHNNMQPSIMLKYVICMHGLFPRRNHN